MQDIKAIISKNIALLRQRKGITQAELGELLCYSDKAISKWERGESLPDIGVLVKLSEIFGVTLDYLVSENHGAAGDVAAENEEIIRLERKASKRKHVVITCMSACLVFLLATAGFALEYITGLGCGYRWMHFVIAVPIAAVVLLVLGSIWFSRGFRYTVVSLLMWSVLAAAFLGLLLYCGINAWLLFVLGAPGQIIIILWSKMKFTGKKA